MWQKRTVKALVLREKKKPSQKNNVEKLHSLDLSPVTFDDLQIELPAWANADQSPL